METRICNKCNVEKPISEFGSNRAKNSNAYRNQSKYKKSCKDCTAEYARQWRAQNKGYTGTGKLKKFDGEDPKVISALRTKITEAKSNNQRTNRPFNITLDDVYEVYRKQNGRCIYTGESFSIEKRHPGNVSIDKINPELGYVKGNIQLVCWAVNRAKGDLTEEQFINMCRAVVEGATTIPRGSTLK